MKKQPSKTSILSRSYYFAAPWKYLLTCAAIPGMLILHSSSLRADFASDSQTTPTPSPSSQATPTPSSQATPTPSSPTPTPEKKPAESASIDFGTAEYNAHAVGKGLFTLFGSLSHFQLIVSGLMKGDTATVHVSAAESKKRASGTEQDNGDRESQKNVGATSQEVITLERREGILALVNLERTGPRGSESVVMESNPDIGFGPTVALKKGKEYLSGQINPGTPIVPFQALPVWFATQDGKKLTAEKDPAIYVVLDTEVIRCNFYFVETSHRQTWHLLQSTTAKGGGLEINLEYRDEKSQADKTWPDVITLDINGSAGVRFEKEEK